MMSPLCSVALLMRWPLTNVPRVGAEIDQRDGVAGDLDDRVHAADRVVLETQVRRGDLADLDDRLGERLLAEELVATEDAEREGNASRHG